MKKTLRNSCLSLCILALILAFSLTVRAQTPAPAAPATPAAAAPTPVVTPADAELKDPAGKAPAAADLAKADPVGTIPRTINDFPSPYSKTASTLPDVPN